MTFKYLTLVLVGCILYSFTTNANDNNHAPEPLSKLEFQDFKGFFNFSWNETEGKIYLKIPVSRLNQEFLYVNSLAAGLGSNDIGLDRGQLGDTRIVKFLKIGPKVLMLQPNTDYRASGNNLQEKRAVEEAFAQSAIWGFEADKEKSSDKEVVIDITDFLLRDSHGVIQRLKRTNQGNFRLDKSRSAIYLPNTLAFPDNSEFEAILTFTGDDPGNYVRQVAPSPEDITLRMHHSFIKLPDDNYTPRKFNPAAGYFGISYLDYAKPIDEHIDQRFISRHRLKKKDPEAEMSEAVEPIIYYLDPGTPEPIRSALLEGASWWNQAFESIGYKDAFQVKILPEGAHPLDVRYNVIQWVHRSTRGWSYGSSVRDPRTGEIIKGHVSLGSLRVRQDFLIARGLLGKPGTDPNDPRLEMALARLRQLSAHEVGHTLGLAHNFAASTADRASVMDYPYPLIEIKDGNIDLSNAYDDKIGPWDKIAIAYGYQDFPMGLDESNQLAGILKQAQEQQIPFISDQDARPSGSAHATGHLWDNGKDAASELSRLLDVRSLAMKNFSRDYLEDGEPTAYLEEILVPLYLMHRYQIDATAKMIGGMKYNYESYGDGSSTATILSGHEQNNAIQALLSCIHPSNLIIPERIVAMIPPRPIGYPDSRELFNSHTGSTFDQIAAAEVIVKQVLGLLLHPQRSARLIEFNARSLEYPNFDEMLDLILTNTVKFNAGEIELQSLIHYQTQLIVVREMIELATNANASDLVRSKVHHSIIELKSWLESNTMFSKKPVVSQRIYLLELIHNYERQILETNKSTPLSVPDGSPIGTNTSVNSNLMQCDF